MVAGGVGDADGYGGYRGQLVETLQQKGIRDLAVLALMVPSIFGVGVYYLNITVSAILASLLPQGSVSYLYYAQRLFEFPQGVFTVSVAQAVLPSMSRQAAEGDIDALKESLQFGLRLLLFITMPAMGGLIICATPVFSLLFMGGEFDFVKAQQCGIALVQYSLGLSCVAMVRVLAPAFYAMKDTRTPVITAFAAFVVNLVFSLILMRSMLHAGLALASSLSALCNMLLLMYLLKKKIGGFGGRRIATAAVKGLLASIPACLIALLVLRTVDWSQSGAKILKLAALGGAVAVAVLIYAGLSLLLKSEESHELKRLLQRKFARW